MRLFVRVIPARAGKVDNPGQRLTQIRHEECDRLAGQAREARGWRHQAVAPHVYTERKARADELDWQRLGLEARSKGPHSAPSHEAPQGRLPRARFLWGPPVAWWVSRAYGTQDQRFVFVRVPFSSSSGPIDGHPRKNL